MQGQHYEVLLRKCSDLWETDRKMKRAAGKFNYRRTTQKLTLFHKLANCQVLLPYLKIQKQLLAPEDKRQNPNLCLLSMSVSTNVKFWPTWLTVRLRQRQNKGKNECAVSFLIKYLIMTSRWTCNISFLSGTLYKWTENLHTSREQIVS